MEKRFVRLIAVGNTMLNRKEINRVVVAIRDNGQMGVQAFDEKGTAVQNMPITEAALINLKTNPLFMSWVEWLNSTFPTPESQKQVDGVKLAVDKKRGTVEYEAYHGTKLLKRFGQALKSAMSQKVDSKALSHSFINRWRKIS